MSTRFRLMLAGLWMITSGFAGPTASDPKCQTNAEATQLSGKVMTTAVWGKGMYVAVHKTNILTSPDRIHWTAQDSGSVSSLYGVAFGGDRFVAIGNEGLILSSLDGQIWSVENSATDDRLRGIAYGNGTFVAVGHSGIVVTSSDSHVWRRQNSGTDTRLQAIAYGNGLFVAVGWKGTVLTSSDGAQWARQTKRTRKNLYRVACNNGTFVAADRLGVEGMTDWIPLTLEIGSTARDRR